MSKSKPIDPEPSDREPAASERDRKFSEYASRSESASSRWSLGRGPLYWTVITYMNPVVSLLALIFWLNRLRRE
jgi:hypothetical protein